MNCLELRELLLDAAEDALSEAEGARLSEHLAGCEACRTELAALRRAARAVRESADALAPRGPYLTAQRMERLMAAYREGPRIFRLVTYRQFVAAAAAAAILVSVAFIASDVARMQRPAEEPQAYAEAPTPGYVPVVLAAMGQDEPVNVVRTVSLGADAGRPQGSAVPAPRLAGTDSAGVRIPVNHAFYDPDESSRWW